MEPTAPPESRHALDLAALRDPSVRLWAVHGAAGVLATGAVKDLGEGHHELKSMRTDPASRGQGLGSRMVRHLVADARSRGAHRIWLETGSMDFFAPARAMYARAGFVECGPFGSYVPDPLSTFMTLDLVSAGQ
ncbi:GNAT family N-acetyltransferase [Luteipulveratus halotolerans]